MGTKIKKFLTPSGSLLPQPKPGSSEKEWNEWADEAFWSPEINTEVEYPKRRKIADEAISKIRTRAVLNPNYTYVAPDNELDELVVTAQASNKPKTFFIDPNNWTSEYDYKADLKEYEKRHYELGLLFGNHVRNAMNDAGKKIGSIALIGSMIPAAAAAPLAFIGGAAGGYLGAKATDKVVNWGTDGKYNTWSDWLVDKADTPYINHNIAEMLNPGALVGGTIGGVYAKPVSSLIYRNGKTAVNMVNPYNITKKNKVY